MSELAKENYDLRELAKQQAEQIRKCLNTIKLQDAGIQRLKEFNEQLKDAVIKTSFLDGETFIADLEKEFEAAPPQGGDSDE